MKHLETTLKILSIAVLPLFFLSCAAENKGRKPDEKDAGADADVDGDADSDADGDVDDAGNDGSMKTGGCSKMDILFVIDNSPSMVEEQTNLTQNFPKFIEVLDNYKSPIGTHIEYRVGVTTTAVNRTFNEKIFGTTNPIPITTTGADGKLLGKANCGFSNPWIDGPGTNVAQDFSCAAMVGDNGPGYEMPLAAMENALDKYSAPDGGPNAGFYRKDENSLLVVVIITDEDDCSVEPGGIMALTVAGVTDCDETKSEKLYVLEDVKSFLDNLTGGKGRYVMTAIADPGPASCDSAFGSAICAKRLVKFVKLFDTYGVFGNICDGDLSLCLGDALDTMQLACNDFPPLE